MFEGRGKVAVGPSGGDIETLVEFEDGRVGVLLAGMRVEEARPGELTVGDCLGSLNLNSKAAKAFSSPLRSRFRCVCEDSVVVLRVTPGGGCMGDLLGETFGEVRV